MFELINYQNSLEYHIVSKAQNSKSKSHGLVFVISPVSKENGTYYWRKQCSCYIYYCLYFHFLNDFYFFCILFYNC